MSYLSDFVWLFSARASRVIAGLTLGMLALVAMDGGYSVGQPAGARQFEADLRTKAARQAALQRIAAFVDSRERHIQPQETGVPRRGGGLFSKNSYALVKPSSIAAPDFFHKGDIRVGIAEKSPARPGPPIDTLWRLNASRS